jgi:hypothetical protein
MTVFQIIFNDIFLLVLIVGLLFYHIFIQRKLEMKIANIEAEYDLLLESKGGLVSDEGEIEKTSSALDKASKDRTPEEFKAFQESVNKRVEENEKELKKVIEVLKTVTLEIKNMKDAIRERTIDLEL